MLLHFFSILHVAFIFFPTFDQINVFVSAKSNELVRLSSLGPDVEKTDLWQEADLRLAMTNVTDTSHCHQFSTITENKNDYVNHKYFIGCFGDLTLEPSYTNDFQYFNLTGMHNYSGIATITARYYPMEMKNRYDSTTSFGGFTLKVKPFDIFEESISFRFDVEYDSSTLEMTYTTVKSSFWNSIIMFTHFANGLILIMPFDESNYDYTNISQSYVDFSTNNTIYSPFRANYSNNTLNSPCMVEDTKRNYIWSMGGLANEMDNWLVAFNLNSTDWTEIDTSGSIIQTYYALLNHGSCVYSENKDSLIYLGGINDGTNLISHDIIVYNIQRNNWMYFNDILISGHLYGDATIVQSIVYIVGGIDNNGSVLETFNIDKLEVEISSCPVVTQNCSQSVENVSGKFYDL